MRTKIVQIAIYLVKAYDFMSQYTLNVLNRSKNSKMGEIGLKSLKLCEIGQKYNFTTDLTLSAQKNKCESMFPLALYVK